MSSFFLRHHYISTILQSCDALVSPSHFLIERYRSCGVDHPLFEMIENGLPSHLESSRGRYDAKAYSEKLHRFAYFGQLNPYKGVLLLLKAVYHLKKRRHTRIQLSIYGGNLGQQSQLFREKFKRYHHKVADQVVLRGGYQQSDVNRLMAENDWIVVPSIWWENSPVVIQEAFASKRPVIGSSIGGILEKIKNKGGVLFNANSETSLASALGKCMGNAALHQQLVLQIQNPFSAADCWAQHKQLYSRILNCCAA